MASQGLFVGLVTLDFIYLTATVPSLNQKIVADDYTVAAGGPATNAAVTFSSWKNQAKLLGSIGTHPITQLLRADLADNRVVTEDLDPDRSESPPVSSIIITRALGDRAVISINATKAQIPANHLPEGILLSTDIVLIDGHQMAISVRLAQEAKANNIPVVIDGGSWKPGFENVLPFVDYAIASENFYPPNCHQPEEVIAYLLGMDIPYVAITHGEKPIRYATQDETGWVDVPQVQAVDTLGAGDIFHGAFCHYILQKNFTEALAEAAKVAASSCEFFGTRRWLQERK